MTPRFICLIIILGFLSTHALSEEVDSTLYAKLLKKNAGGSLINFSTETLRQYGGVPNNYSLIVLFTAEGKTAQQQCPLCEPIANEYNQVFRVFRQTLGEDNYNSSAFHENPVFFAKCEISKCYKIAVEAGWQSIPQLIYISPQTKQLKPTDNLDLQVMGNIMDKYDAIAMANFVREKTDYPLVIRPPMYQTVGLYVAVIAGIYLLVRVVIPQVIYGIRKPMFWFFASLCVYFSVMAGTVFNSINNPPWMYVHPQSGQVYYIYPSSRQQFVLEGILLATALTALGLLVIAINKYVPKVDDPWKQRFWAFVLTFSFYAVFSWVMMIFRMKNQGYPL